MNHYHRMFVVAVLILVLYLIKQWFDASRSKKEGFLSDGETIGIIIPIALLTFIGFVFFVYRNSAKME
jgi:cbb3-type cytochrome oxidase subunit 3